MQARQSLLDQLRTDLHSLRYLGQSTKGCNAIVNQFTKWACAVSCGIENTTDKEIDYKCYHLSVVLTGVLGFNSSTIDSMNNSLKQLVTETEDKMTDTVVNTTDSNLQEQEILTFIEFSDGSSTACKQYNCKLSTEDFEELNELRVGINIKVNGQYERLHGEKLDRLQEIIKRMFTQ